MTASNVAETFTVRPPIALVRGLGPSETRTEGARRALNVSVAMLGILVAAPVMFVVAALIRLTSRGPVVFVQTRGPCAYSPRRSRSGRVPTTPG